MSVCVCVCVCVRVCDSNNGGSRYKTKKVKKQKKGVGGGVIQSPLGMSKNGGSGCDGCPYLVMSQTVSAREQGITTLLARLPFHYLSICLQPFQSNPLFFVFISSVSSLSPTPKFIYALFLSLRAYLAFPSVFVCAFYFLPSFLPFFFFFNLVSSPSSPLINSLIFFLLLPITVYRPDSCRSAVPGVFLCFFATRLAADGECLAELYLSRV